MVWHFVFSNFRHHPVLPWIVIDLTQHSIHDDFARRIISCSMPKSEDVKGNVTSKSVYGCALSITARIYRKLTVSMALCEQQMCIKQETNKQIYLKVMP